MKLFQKLIAAPAIISMASGFAVNAAEINSTDLGDYSNSSNLVSLGDFKSDTLFPGDCGASNSVDLSGDVSFSASSGFGDGWEIGFGASGGEGGSKGLFT